MAVSWSTNVEKAINFVKQALVILLDTIEVKTMFQHDICIVQIRIVCNSFCFS